MGKARDNDDLGGMQIGQPQKRLLKARPRANKGQELLGPIRPRGWPKPGARAAAKYNRIERHVFPDHRSLPAPETTGPAHFLDWFKT
jgi:hypothetical protein